jgi:hypothetical protein
MALEDSGHHPQWPKVVDAVIEAEKFMAFFAERSKEPGVISLDDIERKLAHGESAL